jgi:glucokinase
MFLGVEIGGTKLQLGIGPGDGTLTALWRGAIAPTAGAAGICAQIEQALPVVLAQAGAPKLRAAGIGFGGPIDDRTRSVLKSHQVQGWEGVALADWLQARLGVPVALGNDADVAGLAEARYGAGRGYSPVFYVTAGSGVGGGLIIADQIYRGCGRGAAEIGHLRVQDGRTVESWASGWGIGATARAQATADPVGSATVCAIAGSGAAITAQHVGQAAARGDPFAQAVLATAIAALAEGLTHVITLLCPQRIVLGGGVALIGEPFVGPLRQALAERTFAPFAGLTEVVLAELGESVVVQGALALATEA